MKYLKLVGASVLRVFTKPVVFKTKSPALAPVNEIVPIVKSSGEPMFSKTIVKGAELVVD